MRPSRSLLLLAVAAVFLGCAPPPLDDASASGATTDEGSDSKSDLGIRILFPQTRDDVVICPTTVIAVAIDELELTDYNEHAENEAGHGHWHLFDSSEYVGAFIETWGVVTLEHDGGAPEARILTASLAENDHTALSKESTVEILIGTEGCIGGDPAAEAPNDTGDTGDTG